MKARITRVRVHKLTGPLNQRFGWSLNWTKARSVTLVEVNTDCGLSGWGDGEYGGDLLLAHPELVIGRSPLDFETIFDDLRSPVGAQHDRGEPSSAGLDAALWDLAGRMLGLPIWKMLG